MPSTRRRFLNRLLGGCLASVGLLGLPAKLWAGRRGRRGGSCCPPPVCYPPPGCAVPLAAAPIQGFYGDVNPLYPPPAGLNPIPGGGAFCCWGTFDSSGGVKLSDVKATNAQGVPLTKQPTRVNITNDMGGDFGFAVANYASQSGFYLVYYYTKNGVNLSAGPYGPYGT